MTPKERMEAILREEMVGHLGLAVGGEVYVVPINYTYSEGRVLFHCALTGRKLDMIRANPRVCFEVSRMQGLPTPHDGDECDAPFESVICWGEARIVGDLEERQEILNAFQARYLHQGEVRPDITMERTRGCGCVEITVTRMTGRCAPGTHKEAWEWDA